MREETTPFRNKRIKSSRQLGKARWWVEGVSTETSIFLTFFFEMREVTTCFHFDENDRLGRKKWDNSRKKFLEK